MTALDDPLMPSSTAMKTSSDALARPRFENRIPAATRFNQAEQDVPGAGPTGDRLREDRGAEVHDAHDDEVQRQRHCEHRREERRRLQGVQHDQYADDQRDQTADAEHDAGAVERLPLSHDNHFRR